MNFWYYFILYLIYSVLGWIVEVCDTLIEDKKLVNRGFMIGPYCPIYGKGALLVTWLLNNYIDKPIGLFVMSMAICSIIEYVGSYMLEKLFNTRWWDYSHKKFNINGRICLENIIPFGIGCMLVMYIINPILNHFLSLIPSNILTPIATMLFGLYVLDFFVSFKIIWRFKNLSKGIKKDNTEKVTEYVKKEVLKTNQVLYTRIIKAFPRFKILERFKRKK